MIECRIIMIGGKEDLRKTNTTNMNNDYTSVIMQILADGLRPHGFNLAKGSRLFIRVLNGEIIQIIYPRFLPAPDPGVYTFTIETTINSIYISRLSKKTIYGHKKLLYQFLSAAERAVTPWQKYCYVYDSDNVQQISDKALDDVIKYIIPSYNTVTTLKRFVEYSFEKNLSDLYPDSPICCDNLVWYALSDEPDTEKLIKSLVPLMKEIHKNDRQIIQSEAALQEKAELFFHERYLEPLSNIKNDSVKMKKIAEEMDVRKKNNVDFLTKCKINV